MSNIINFAGLYFIICLQSSDPIDPPPPVTNTFFPFIRSVMFLLSSFIVSLPSKSSISTSLKLFITPPFFIISSVLGNTLVLTPVV